MDRRCETCRYWVSKTEECRARAPQVIVGQEYLDGGRKHRNVFETRFPATDKDIWCGEWQPKEGAGER